MRPSPRPGPGWTTKPWGVVFESTSTRKWISARSSTTCAPGELAVTPLATALTASPVQLSTLHMAFYHYPTTPAKKTTPTSNRAPPLTRLRFAPAGLPSWPASRRRIWAASRTIAPRRSSRRTRSAGARVRAAPPRMRRARRARTRRSRRATVQGARRASGRRVWHPPRRHRPSRHPPSAPHHPPHHPRTAGAAQPDAGRPGLRGAE